MNPEEDYIQEIDSSAARVFEIMSARVSDEELEKLKRAYYFAKDAHKNQKRKSGHPYIIHPIAVALIAAEELRLDSHCVMAAFLHDVVEDTPHIIEEIRDMFGEDVAFLVDVVTKKKGEHSASKQVDNFKQLLDSMHYDIRALLIKLADRLHNMRTLSSMRIDKQMKIAGETDYFYAPLANRLGLFDVKTDLENLAFKYRCEVEYNDIERDLSEDMKTNRERIDAFVSRIENILTENGISARARAYYRKPYSIWRKMKSGNVDFKHVENKYYVRVTFSSDSADSGLYAEKNTCLKIYSILTDCFKEKTGSFINQIDQPKENAYRCIQVMLLNGGIWEDVQICSDSMVESSRYGCMVGEHENKNISRWMSRFKMVLDDMASQEIGGNYMDSVVSTLYYVDIMAFTPEGLAVRLPAGSSVIDMAFEIDVDKGKYAKFAHVNGKLCSVKTELHQGDCVEIGYDMGKVMAKEDWLEFAVSYNAKRNIRRILQETSKDKTIHRCPICQPIPGGDIIGFRESENFITVHRRSCPSVIEKASQSGDSIVKVDFDADEKVTYPVTVSIRAVDRYHLLMDIVEDITNHLHLSIDSLTTVTKDEIVECKVTFMVHSVSELVSALEYIYTIDGVDEVSGIGIR